MGLPVGVTALLYAGPKLYELITRPKVESAFVGLTLHAPPLLAEQMPGFVDLVRLAFNQRRKTLRNALAVGWERARAEEALRRAGVNGGRRAEDLGLAELVRLHG